MPFVTIRIADQEGHERISIDRDRVVVGRSSSCDVPIPHTSISREHCVITRLDGTWFVQDQGSANGTRLAGGDKLTAPKALNEKDVILIGKARLTFHLGTLDQKREADRLEHGESGINRRPKNMDEPVEAMVCGHCGVWLSIAHRLAGDTTTCPRCLHGNTVPEVA